MMLSASPPVPGVPHREALEAVFLPAFEEPESFSNLQVRARKKRAHLSGFRADLGHCSHH